MSELVRKVKADDGMSTTEYALGTVAVGSIGTIIIALLKQQWFNDLLEELVKAVIAIITKLLGLS